MFFREFDMIGSGSVTFMPVRRTYKVWLDEFDTPVVLATGNEEPYNNSDLQQPAWIISQGEPFILFSDPLGGLSRNHQDLRHIL